MIGILCSDYKEKKYIEQLHSLFKGLKKRYDDPIIVFTVCNIDFNSRTVKGSLVAGEKIEIVQVPIPSIIFNLSLQRDNSGVKSRKVLEEMEVVELVNHINKFNQWMVMDILSSSEKTKKHLLPYHIYNKIDRSYKPEENRCYIAMPAKGASLSRVIYAQPDPQSELIKGTQYFKKGHICDYIDASMCQDVWIFIEVPDLMLNHYQPIIVRCYLQRGHGGSWNLIGKDIYPEELLERRLSLKRIEEPSLLLIDYVSNFMTSLGHCFIDLLLDIDGNPYFLHLGGFEQNFLKAKQTEDFHKYFYNNMIKLARFYSRMHGEV
jgi:hypothetical protein